MREHLIFRFRELQATPALLRLRKPETSRFSHTNVHRDDGYLRFNGLCGHVYNFSVNAKKKIIVKCCTSGPAKLPLSKSANNFTSRH